MGGAGCDYVMNRVAFGLAREDWFWRRIRITGANALEERRRAWEFDPKME